MNRFLVFVLHCFGAGSLIAAVFLQLLVFSDILLQGYFLAEEQNRLVLASEVGLSVFAVFYLLYVVWKLIRVKLRVTR